MNLQINNIPVDSTPKSPVNGIKGKKQRIANDYYPTEEKLTLALLKHQPIFGTVLECCSAGGQIANVFRDNGNQVSTNDIDPQWTTDYRFDASKPEGWQNTIKDDQCFDWIITNPPFGVAPAIIPLAYDHCNHGIAMLLRITWLEPCGDRAEFLQAHPPTKVIVFNPRPKFRADTRGTDSATVAWFIWHKFGCDRQTRLVFENEWNK